MNYYLDQLRRFFVRAVRREEKKALKNRGHLETKEHVLKAVLHNEENPGAVPMGRNRHERRAIAAAVRRGKRALAKVKKQMVKP